MDRYVVEYEGVNFELHGVGAKAVRALVDEIVELRTENERLRAESERRKHELLHMHRCCQEQTAENERLRELVKNTVVQ